MVSMRVRDELLMNIVTIKDRQFLRKDHELIALMINDNVLGPTA